MQQQVTTWFFFFLAACAAIASSGGSVAGEAAYSALSKTIKNYLSKGGSAEKATVECKDGSCTISDGTVEETCDDCVLVEDTVEG